MYNDFVIIGPPDDPAAIANAPDTRTALQRIAGTGAVFASRGDTSGTHMKERGLWRAARLPVGFDVHVTPESTPHGR